MNTRMKTLSHYVLPAIGGLCITYLYYLFYYSVFSIPMLMSTCLSVFVRNDSQVA